MGPTTPARPPLVAAPAEQDGEWAVAQAGARFVAYTIDSLLVIVAAAAVTAALVRIGIVSETPRTGLDAIVVGLLSTVIELVYLVALWTGARQATVGMRALGIRIVRESNGGRLDLQQALARWLLLTGALSVIALLPVDDLVLGGAFLIWFIVLLASVQRDPNRQGIHDRVAGSLVLRRAGASSAVGCLIAVVLAVALSAFLVATMPPAVSVP